MSLKKNIIANYINQIYVMFIGIVMVPSYIRYMGAEAYGLIGFFSMLQSWFQLLDMGLTPTLARETARYRGGAIDASVLRRLIRALEVIFLGIALLGAFALAMSSNYIASDWLKVKALNHKEVRDAVVLMGGVIALRWIAGLYRGAVSGFEHQVWLSGFNVIIATLRFVVVLPVMIWVGATPIIFFSYQLAIAVIEILIVIIQVYRLLPKVSCISENYSWTPIKGVLKFSMTIAFTGSVWVFVTQTDKLILSKFLTLSDYAYYSLGVLIASSINLVGGPISGALMPRLTKLEAEGKNAELLNLYRQATQAVCLIATSLACVLAFFAEPVLLAWSGNPSVVRQAAPVLILYAIGNGILAVSAFPYYLQYAKGHLKLHLIGNLFFVVLLIPSLIWATIHYGVLGAGYTWILANLMYFLFWVPVVHGYFAPGLHKIWLIKDVLAIAIPSVVVAYLLKQFLLLPTSRLSLVIALLLIGLLVLVMGTITTTSFQHKLKNVRERMQRII